MSLIDLHVDDAVEPRTIPEGTEVQVRILKASLEISDNNNEYILAILEVPTEPTAKDFRHMMMVPTSEDSEKQQNARKYRIKEFCEAFGLSTSSINPESWDGSQAWAILRETEHETYGLQNSVRKFLAAPGTTPGAEAPASAPA